MNKETKFKDAYDNTTYNVYIDAFDGFNEMLDTVNNRPNNAAMRNADSSRSSDKSFTGTRTYEEAQELIIRGWEEGCEKMNQIKEVDEEVAKLMTMKKPKDNFDMVGYVPSVGRFMIGHPQSMKRRTPTDNKRKVITICMNIGVSCGVASKEIMKQGQLFAAVIDFLERNGYAVSLYVLWQSHNDRNIYSMITKVKDFSERLNLPRIAFTVGHPSMLRRFGFKGLETCPLLEEKHRGFAGGYGTPIQHVFDSKTQERVHTLTQQVTNEMFKEDNVYTYYLRNQNNTDLTKLVQEITNMKVA